MTISASRPAPPAGESPAAGRLQIDVWSDLPGAFTATAGAGGMVSAAVLALAVVIALAVSRVTPLRGAGFRAAR